MQLPPGQGSQLIASPPPPPPPSYPPPPPPPASRSLFHLTALTKAQTVGQDLHSTVMSLSLAGEDDATGSVGKEELGKASATIADSRLPHCWTSSSSCSCSCQLSCKF